MVDVKKVLLIIGIALILAFFVGQGVSLVFEQPQWDVYCNETYAYAKPLPVEGPDPAVNQTYCESVNGSRWEGTYCNFQYECGKQYQDAYDIHTRNVFIAQLIIGIILIIVSFMIKHEPISIGVLSGGLLCILWGAILYWGQAAKLIRLILLGVALAVLMWIAYRKFNK